MKNRIPLYVFSALLIIWIIGIFVNFDHLARKEDNPDYIKYLKEYKDSVQRDYERITSQLSNDYGIEYSGERGSSFSPCIISNFEGAEVKVAGIQLFDKIYDTRSKRDIGTYSYQCNEASLDPDHFYYGLPDVNITVSAVEYYQPEESSFARLFEWGKKDYPRPYKTYSKRIIVRDTTDHFYARLMDIQLWLTTFNVVITINSTRDQAMLNIPENEMNQKIYPRLWYNQSGGGNVSINDLRRPRENQENLYGDLTFSLEINPNASPWYIKLPNAQTERPDIAVAAVYCKHFEKKSLEESKLTINTFAGSAEPLYFTAFEKDDTLKFSSELDKTAGQLIGELSEVRRNDIWNKPYYLRLHSNNIGSRRKNLNINQQDDQINMTFLMPLFVIGSLDVLVPKEIIPKWDPPEPYKRKFGLGNLLPNWGFKLGRILSIIVIGVIAVLFVVYVLPILKRIT